MNCPNCTGVSVSPEGLNGEKVCAQCGLVIRKPISMGAYAQWNPEWYSNWGNEDSDAIKEWLTTLRTVSSQLGLAKFPYREEAARTIRKRKQVFAQSQKLGKNKRATVAALIHLILKEYNKTRSIKEICQELGLDQTMVMKQTWILNKTLNNSDNDQKSLLKIQRKTAKDYLREQGTKITNNKEILREAEEILSRVQKKGGNPIGIAAGALYFSFKLNNEEGSKDQIAQAFGISLRTVDTNELKIRRLNSKMIKQSTGFGAKRSNLEMYVEVINALAQKEPVKLTHIMHKANLDYVALKKAIDFLLLQGLIEESLEEEDKVVFTIIARGMAVLKYFGEANKGVPMVERTRSGLSYK